ncbi:MAG: hypothetical protein KKD63_06790 [Proteobacteria bacterium]|nr:hypothetical protein [Desulfobulbaceae bacterium]MBU4152569.1 hypothetical protein [Pseudomonadota bacterium]MDP2107242.1 hypothetical protein [Desulfobulbaceae bacterium]
MEIMPRLATLYAEMEQAYSQVSTLLDFSCKGCPDNCCDSYFQHHTYIEWAYLRQGFDALPADRQAEYQRRSRSAIASYQKALIKGERPQVMCPINDDGLCGLYHQRLMICRLHGVPASMTSPNGQQHQFPGCFRCQELTKDLTNVTTMDRTRFFKTMVGLEQEFLRGRSLPRIKMTLAEMLVTELPNTNCNYRS